MVQDGAGESLRSLCILCASRYDSDKAVTRSRSCMLNPVDPNAVENTTCIKMKVAASNFVCIVCMGLRGSYHMNSSKSMRHQGIKCLEMHFAPAANHCWKTAARGAPLTVTRVQKKTIESRFENTFKASQHFAEAIWDNMGFSAMGFGCRTLLERANPVSSSLFSAVAATSGPA